MTKCSNCGTEGSRIRSRWDEKGSPLPDECPHCDPSSFAKFTAPSDQKIWPGWEAHPNEYEKRYDSEGVFYLRKPEYRDEQEQRLAQPARDEAEKQRLAEEKKRKERRTQPMNPTEHLQAIARAREIAGWIEGSAAKGIDVN